MIDISGVKIAPTINVPRKKNGDQKAIAQIYYDMYAMADSLAVEDIKIQARQMVHEKMEDIIEEKETPRKLSIVEIYKMRVERTAFHLNNMIAMFNKWTEGGYPGEKRVYDC